MSHGRHGGSCIHGKNSQTEGSAQVDTQPGHSSDAAFDLEFKRTTRIHGVNPQKATPSDIPCDYEKLPLAPSQRQVYLSDFGPMLRNDIITLDAES